MRCAVPDADDGSDTPFRAIFIRAPAILSAGPGVEVLAEYALPEEKRAELRGTDAEGIEKIIVAVKQGGNLLATSFHPEVTSDVRWHKLFLEMSSAAKAYAGVGEDAVRKASESEIALIHPGLLPTFTDSVFAGAAQQGLSLIHI